MKNYLNFENDIKNLEGELGELKDSYNQKGLAEVDTDKISKIQSAIDNKLNEVYSNLNSWQKTQVARHEDRPKAKFFIENLFEDFIPLAGDRFYGEDKSVIAGLAKFNQSSVLVIGQEKGDDLDSRIERNFGMMRPEGYRKSIRLMKLADKFRIQEAERLRCSGGNFAGNTGFSQSRAVKKLEDGVTQVAAHEEIDATPSMVRFLLAHGPLVLEKCTGDLLGQGRPHAWPSFAVVQGITRCQ